MCKQRRCGYLMKRKINNAPLLLALTQIRFTPINIKDCIQDVQDELRVLGYPRVDDKDVHEFLVENNQPKLRQFKVWEFTNKEKTESVVVTNDFIAFQTVAYDTYREFEKKVKPILRVLSDNAQMDLSMVTRVGMRYTDSIVKKGSQSFSDLLEGWLVGPDSERFFSESLMKTDQGVLQIKCLRDFEGNPLPPDLMHNKLELNKNLLPAKGEERMFLDFDHYNEQEVEFNVDSLCEKIDLLHKRANDEFFNSIKEGAFD